MKSRPPTDSYSEPAFQQPAKLLLRLLNLWNCVNDYIGVVGIPFDEILVILFGWVEALQLVHLRHDRLAEHMGLFELLDISFRNPLLFLPTKNIDLYCRP